MPQHRPLNMINAESRLALADSPQPRGKSWKGRKKKEHRVGSPIDDIFLPKDTKLDSVEMDVTLSGKWSTF